MDIHYSYQDIFLKPSYSPFESRNEISTGVSLGDRSFRLPVIPANMKCVIDHKIAENLSENGYFYIMHRFGYNLDFVREANERNWKTISISVGVKAEDVTFLHNCHIKNYRIDFITIDVAHGHSKLVKKMIEKIKEIYPKVYLIVGNVATRGAVLDLAEWGADCVKVGIAQGNACTTYGKTGFGIPMFSCIKECVRLEFSQRRKTVGGCPHHIPIIADGGVRTNGDLAISLAAGATIVMAGGIFAACIDSPADNIMNTTSNKINPEITHKRYYGSASIYNKNSSHHIEGTVINIPCNGMRYSEKLIEIAEDLQSAVSYAGGDLSTSLWGVRYSR